MDLPQLPAYRRVRAVTLTAELIRIVNDKQPHKGEPSFRAWAEKYEATREKHNGEIKPRGEIEETLIWVADYCRGKYGKPCPLDITQLQDVLELADFTTAEFRADGSWGYFTSQAMETVLTNGIMLWQPDASHVSDSSSGKR